MRRIVHAGPCLLRARRFTVVSVASSDRKANTFATLKSYTKKGSGSANLSGRDAVAQLYGEDATLSDDEKDLKDAAFASMRFRIEQPTQFYFKSDNVCRLCNEYVLPKEQSYHLRSPGRGMLQHGAREIVLDSLLYYAKAGHDPRKVLRDYPYKLYNNKKLFRMEPLLPRDLNDVSDRAARIFKILLSLKEWDVLRHSISPHAEPANSSVTAGRIQVKRRGAFERLECIGDSAWGSSLSSRAILVFDDKKWGDCHMYQSFTNFRDMLETNIVLERAFDLLKLEALLPESVRDLCAQGKIKADVLEAILGELDMFLYAYESNLWYQEEYPELSGERIDALSFVVRHTLTEIFDLIILTSVFYIADQGALNIAFELSLDDLTWPMRPRHDVGDVIRTRAPTFNQHYRPRFFLPRPPHLESQPAPLRNIEQNEKDYGPTVNYRRLDKAKFYVNWKQLKQGLWKSEILSPIERLRLKKRLQVTPLKQYEFEGSLPTLSRFAFDPGQQSWFAVSLRRAPSSAPRSEEPLLPPPIAPYLQESTGEELLKGVRRSACPYPQLSAIPPVTHNPYALAVDQWASLWRRCGSDIFEDADPDIVMAQFEASASLTASRNTGHLLSKFSDELMESTEMESSDSESDHQRRAHLQRHHPFHSGVSLVDTASLSSIAAAFLSRLDAKNEDELDLDDIRRRNAKRKTYQFRKKAW